MNKIFGIVIAFVLCAGAIVYSNTTTTQSTKVAHNCSTIYVDHHQPLTEWQTFILALIEIESDNNPKAKGKTNDGGIFQITPIYIKEVNRLQCQKRYKLEDRYDIAKSIEMFTIINDSHNKTRNIDKAIKLHNPNASSIYSSKIKKKMTEIAKRESIRHHCVIAVHY